MSRLRNKIGFKSPDILVKGNQSKVVKNEFECPGNQVFHRKSERRRMARDIFLVFEEEPKSRRTATKSNKQTRTKTKSKFGHLKVGELNNSFNKSKNVICSIKKESNYFVSTSCNNNKGRKAQGFNTHNTKNHLTTANVVPTAKVNPIFLWVKQDDTRIVEVRCEDYDKRNRIRITKTTNGWRATPRTDPASSRVVKFLPTPLITIKHETILADHKNTTSDIQLNQLPVSKDLIGSFLPYTINSSDSNKKVSKKQKKEKTKRKRGLKKNHVMNSGSPTIKEAVNVKPMCLDLECFDENHIRISNPDTNSSLNYNEKGEDIKSTSFILPNKETYQIDTQNYELCPETGLFIPKDRHEISSKAVTSGLYEINDIVINLEDSNMTINEVHDGKIEKDLDAETKNLKDLLDDADLLQHCSDNANSGSDLIDSLVKHSCENNLITDNEAVKEGVHINSHTENFSESEHILMRKEPVTEILSRINNSINDSPKCLSFNEAGEIEDVNGELFQSNNFIDTFTKQAIDDVNILPLSSKDVVSDIGVTLNEKKISTNCTGNSPKDLSYRKREEVCPPSESRSQCAVTSTSDVKSPCLSSGTTFEPTSEAIKNIIFEQFLKLTPFNTIAKQQTEPINLEKSKDSKNTSSGNYATTNFIETVVLDHITDEEEPIKKRVRSSVKNSGIEAKIDKDPDPLTQLKLLIQNTQWKVPDPILVPKDRLGAVLASPAREIPLLLTTRPELKLPEAFAYPEILQNPNILVISMAQLEAILRNDAEAQEQKVIQASSIALPTQNIRCEPPLQGQGSVNPLVESEMSNSECKNSSKCIQVESSLESEINAATLAVMNQMLWLPYFNQFSQDSIKSRTESNTDHSKLKNASLLSFYNQNCGVESLNQKFNNLSRQVTGFDKGNNEQISNTIDFSNGIHNFPTPVEISIWEKLAQAQIHRMLSLNPISSQRAEHLKESFNEQSSISQQKIVEESTSLKDLKIIKKSLMENNFSTSNMSQNVQCGIMKKTTNADKSNKVECNSSTHSKIGRNQQSMDNKPRLTCKSLSNLLDPETVPLGNLVSDNNKYPSKCDNFKREHNVNLFGGSAAQVAATASQGSIKCTNSSDYVKLSQRNVNCGKATAPENSIKNIETIITDSIPALWHPLFGSNSKQSYSSPWQWTTVTASGE